MTRRAIVFAVVAALAALSLFLLDARLESAAYTIDQANWQGDPLPPCFLDARICGGHVLGTDDNGFDLLARLVVATRVSLWISLLAAILSLSIGGAFGLLARYGGPVIRFTIMRFTEALACFPGWVLFVVVVMFATPPGRVLHPAVLAAIAAVIFSPPVVRYIAFAQELRKTGRPLLNRTARNWGELILFLATVDFFGWGVWRGSPSLGNLLRHMEMPFLMFWWMDVFPAVCILAAALLIEIARRRFLVKAVLSSAIGDRGKAGP